MTTIAQLLDESGMPDTRLETALTDLRRLAASPAPKPGEALAALMTTRRKRPWRTALIVVAALIASLGIGVSTAAAVNPQFRDSTVKIFDQLTQPAPAPTPTETERHGGGEVNDDHGGGTPGPTDDSSGRGSGSSGGGGISGSGGTSGSSGSGGGDDGGSNGKGGNDTQGGSDHHG